MLREVELTHQVVISVKNVDNNKEILASYVIGRHLKQLSNSKAFKYGYLLAVTKLISIGRGENKLNPEYITFPVDFRCRIFMPMAGEVFTGVVHHVVTGGVFLKSGPMHMVYISTRFMPNYLFVPGERAYVRDDSSKIGVGVVVRYSICAVRWVEDKYREFRVLASIDADGLGPVALNGLDGIDS